MSSIKGLKQLYLTIATITTIWQYSFPQLPEMRQKVQEDDATEANSDHKTFRRGGIEEQESVLCSLLFSLGTKGTNHNMENCRKVYVAGDERS